MTADALTTMESCTTILGPASAGTPPAVLLQLLIEEVSDAITRSCNKDYFLVTNALCPQTRYLSGQGDEWLTLPDWPVRQVRATGTLTAGSTAVTGLSFTSPWTVSNLFAGQSVRGTGIAAGTCLTAAVGTTATLDTAATTSGSGVTLTFGLAIWTDATGRWGQGDDAFDDTLNLLGGDEYALKVDQGDGLTSKCGLVFCSPGWSQDYSRPGNSLAAFATSGTGNIKVVFNAGYDAVPPDLEMAALRVIARVRASRRFGQLAQSGGYEGANVSFVADIAATLGVLGGDVAAVLARYRVGGLFAG